MRDQILAMQPGRELDALVAEKVMGWHECSVHGQRAYGKPQDFDHADDPKIRIYDYSTDISAAWEVVEKIGSVKVLGPTIQMDWYASVLGTRKFGVWAHTAPEAICKAALLAVMEE